MFYKHSKEGKIAILIVFVDDIILAGDDHVELKRLKRVPVDDFEIKGLGSIEYFLGWSLPIVKRAFVFLNENMCWIFLERQVYSVARQ